MGKREHEMGATNEERCGDFTRRHRGGCGGEGKGKEGERERIGGNGDDGVMPSLQLLSVSELDFLISVTGLAKFVFTNWLHFT